MVDDLVLVLDGLNVKSLTKHLHLLNDVRLVESFLMHAFLRELLIDNRGSIHRIHKVVHHLPDAIWLLRSTSIKIEIRHD